MATGIYKGRREKDPGRLRFRYKGEFQNETRARDAASKLRKQGLKTRIVRYTDGWSLYVVAPHDFWGKSFIHSTR